MNAGLPAGFFINLFFIASFNAKNDFSNDEINDHLYEHDSVVYDQLENHLEKLFNDLDPAYGLSYDAFRTALIGYFNMKKQNDPS